LRTPRSQAINPTLLFDSDSVVIPLSFLLFLPGAAPTVPGFLFFQRGSIQLRVVFGPGFFFGHHWRPILAAPAGPLTGRPNDARSPAALPAACAASLTCRGAEPPQEPRWMSCSFIKALTAAPLITTSSLPLLVCAAVERRTNSPSRALIRAQAASRNERMMICRSPLRS